MKNLMKALAISFLMLGLANCGGSGGGGSAAPTGNGGVGLGQDFGNNVVTTETNQIQYYENNLNITWSADANNIYISDSGDCFDGLNTQGADDTIVQERFLELANLINTSVIGRGSNNSYSPSSVYLSVIGANGVPRTFNLNNGLAAVDEETLSNGSSIIDFYDRVGNEINQFGNNTCRVGKK